VSTSVLIRSLREGHEINHSAEWKRFYLSHVIAAILICTALLACIAAQIITSILERSEDLPCENNNPAIICLADIETDPSLQLYRFSLPPTICPHPSTGCESLTTAWANRSWSPLAPVIMTVREHGEVPGRVSRSNQNEYYNPSIDYSIYKLQSSGLADAVLSELRRQYEREGYHTDLVEMSAPGFDRLYVGVENNRFSSQIFARKGNTIISFQYRGEADNQVVLDVIAAFLSDY